MVEEIDASRHPEILFGSFSGLGKMGTQRKAFFIAYHYPPVRSAGIERTVKFLHYLPEFGYRPKVLTTSAFGGVQDDQVLRAWEPLKLYRQLFSETGKCGQVPSFVRTDPGVFKGVVKSLRRRVLIPDGQVTWLPLALLSALRTLRRDPHHLLYSTFPPASAHLLGWMLKRFTGLPWVADFRDSWLYDPLDPVLNKVGYRRTLEQGLEGAVVRGADAVVATTDVSAAYLRQTFPEAASAIEVIPNGFEPYEMGPVRSLPKQDPLFIVYTGSFSYSHPQRTPQPMLEALQGLLDDNPIWARRLRLVLVGNLSPSERQAATRLEQAGIVQIKGPHGYAGVSKLQKGAHVLLLVDHVRDWPSSNVPTKFYEYLGAGRPILALSGPGMVERMVREFKAGFHAAGDDSQAIRRVLVEIYGLFRQDALKVGAKEKDLGGFHRRELTRTLAQCFDRVLETSGEERK